MPPRLAVRDAAASPPSPRSPGGAASGVLVDASALQLLLQQTSWITGQMQAMLSQQQSQQQWQQQAMSDALARQQQQQLQEQASSIATHPLSALLSLSCSTPPHGLFSDSAALESALSNSSLSFRLLSACSPRLYPFLPAPRLNAASLHESLLSNLFALVSLGLGAYLVWISVDDSRIKRVLACTAMLWAGVQSARTCFSAALAQCVLRSLLAPLSGDTPTEEKQDDQLEAGTHRRLLPAEASSAAASLAAEGLYIAKASLSFQPDWNCAFGLWPAADLHASSDSSHWWPIRSAASSLVHLLLLLSPLLFLPFLQDAAPDASWFPPSPSNYASAAERKWLFFCESDPVDLGAAAVDRELYPVWFTLALLAALLLAMSLDFLLARSVLALPQIQLGLRERIADAAVSVHQTDAMVHRTLAQSYTLRVGCCPMHVSRWNILGSLYLLATVGGGLLLYSLIIGLWVLVPAGLCVARFVCEGGLSCPACLPQLSEAERKAAAEAREARQEAVARQAEEARQRKQEAAQKRDADKFEKLEAERAKRDQRAQDAAAEKQCKADAKQQKFAAASPLAVVPSSSAAVSSGPVAAIQPDLSPVPMDSFVDGVHSLSSGGDAPAHATHAAPTGSLVQPIAIPPEPLFVGLATPSAVRSDAAAQLISPVLPPSPVVATVTASITPTKRQPPPVYRQGTKPLP